MDCCCKYSVAQDTNVTPRHTFPNTLMYYVPPAAAAIAEWGVLVIRSVPLRLTWPEPENRSPVA